MTFMSEAATKTLVDGGSDAPGNVENFLVDLATAVVTTVTASAV